MTQTLGTRPPGPELPSAPPVAARRPSPRPAPSPQPRHAPLASRPLPTGQDRRADFTPPAPAERRGTGRTGMSRLHVFVVAATAVVLALAGSAVHALSPRSSEVARGTALQRLLGMRQGAATTSPANRSAARAASTAAHAVASTPRTAATTTTAARRAAISAPTPTTQAGTARPPTFVAASSAPGGNTRSERVVVPATARAGDVAVLVLSVTSTSTWSAPAGVTGWTMTGTHNGSSVRSTVWVKALQAGDPGSTIVFTASGYTHAAASVLVYSGIAAAAPVAAIGWTRDANTHRHVTPVVTVPAGAIALSYWVVRTTATTSMTQPAAVSTRTSVADRAGGGLAVQAFVGDSGSPAAGGKYGAIAAWSGVVAEEAGEWTIALQPGTAVAPPPSGGGCSSTSLGLSASGPLVGAAVGGSQTLSRLESEMGMALAVHRMYFGSDQVSSAVGKVKEDLAARRQPWISFGVPYSFAAMAAGEGDAWVRGLVDQLATVGGPVWIAFHHEPENDPSKGTMQDWRRMQEHLAPIVHLRSNNIAFTIILMAWNALYGPSEDRITNVWPGDQNVDIAGFDMYDHYGVSGSTEQLDAPRYVAAMDAFATAHGVRWGLAETAYTAAAAQNDPTWLQDEYAAVVAHHGVSFSYFDSTNNSVADWALTDYRRLSAYSAVLHKTYRLC